MDVISVAKGLSNLAPYVIVIAWRRAEHSLLLIIKLSLGSILLIFL